MGIFDDLFESQETRDANAGRDLGREEKEFREHHDFSFPINEMAGDIEGIGRGPEFKAAREAAREGRPYQAPEKSSNSSNNSDSESNSNSSPSSGGDYCGYSGGGGRSVSSADTGIGSGLLGVLGVIIIGGAIYWNIFGNSNKSNQPQQSHSYTQNINTSHNLSLEENVKRLSNYLNQNNQLTGNFNDYMLVMSPTVTIDASKINIGNQDYDVAFVGTNSIYNFHSSDGGLTWSPLPTRDPFMLKLQEDYGKTGKRGNDLIEQVQKDMNPIPVEFGERISLQQCDWETSSRNHYRCDNPKLHSWLVRELEDNPKPKSKLEGLAQAIQDQSNFSTTIYEYSQRGNDIWAAGDYSTSHRWASGDEYRDASEEDKLSVSRGFICHSPDNGKNWKRQWFSANKSSEPVYGIYFSDSNEGWALTLKGILHTNDKGFSWKKILEPDNSISNLFIISKRRLIVSENRPFLYFYSSGDRGLSWNKIRTTPEYKQKLDEIKESFAGRSVHYGGIYSMEESDKE